MSIFDNKEQYFIVRCDCAGVFFGKIKERTSDEVTMTDVRKLWYWAGANAVEQLAADGTKQPQNCNFTITVSEMVIANPIQIIPCTEAAVTNIKAVREWKR